MGNVLLPFCESVNLCLYVTLVCFYLFESCIFLYSFKKICFIFKGRKYFNYI